MKKLIIFLTFLFNISISNAAYKPTVCYLTFIENNDPVIFNVIAVKSLTVALIKDWFVVYVDHEFSFKFKRREDAIAFMNNWVTRVEKECK